METYSERYARLERERQKELKQLKLEQQLKIKTLTNTKRVMWFI